MHCSREEGTGAVGGGEFGHEEGGVVGVKVGALGMFLQGGLKELVGFGIGLGLDVDACETGVYLKTVVVLTGTFEDCI